jgi:hypothetical protein
MKKILIIISILSLFLSIFITSIKAQSTDENKLDELNNQLGVIKFITGVDQSLDCGFASSEKYNRCCYDKNIDLDISNPDRLNNFDTSSISNNNDNGPISWEYIKQTIKLKIWPSLLKILGLDALGVDFKLHPNNTINPCFEGIPSTDFYNDPSCICLPQENQTEKLCQSYLAHNQKEYDLCVQCAKNKQGIWTAIGCVDGDLNKFISNFILNIAIGIAGGIALLCILYAAFQIQSSQGNTEKIKKAQELLVSCITGLIMIIFSIFILKLIGVNILRIPGLG